MSQDAAERFAEAVQRALQASADALHHGAGVVPVAQMRRLQDVYITLHAVRRELPKETAK